MAEAFTWSGGGGNKLTANDRRRRIAEAMIKAGTDYSPVQHWTQGLSRVAQALVGGWEMDQADKSDAAGVAALAKEPILNPSALAATAPAAAASMSPVAAQPLDAASTPASFSEVAPRLKADLARDFGLNDVQAAAFAGNLAHESGGFKTLQEISPTVPGSRGGFGYAQWTGPRRRQFEAWTAENGLDPTSYEANYGFLKHELANTGEGKVLDSLRQVNDPAAATQLVSEQFLRPGIPGMSSRQKWTQRALLAGNQADLPAAGAAPVAMEGGQPGFFVPPAQQPSMDPQTFNAIQGNDIIPPVFQSEGVGQPWMGTALPAQAPASPQVAAAPLPPARPADLAMPQADLPAPGAVQAMGQFGPAAQAPVEDLSNAPGAGGREGIVQALMAHQGQAAPAQAPAPVQQIAQALAGGQTATTAAPAVSPAVQSVAAALAPQGSPAAPSSDRLASAMRVLNSPYAQPGQRAVAQMIVQQAYKDPTEAEGKKLDLEIKRKTLTKSDDPTSIQEYNLAKSQGETRNFTDWKLAQAKAGASSVNVGGGSDKQIFDAVKESADSARSASTGLNAVRDARAAVKAGAIFGAGADTKLALQKIGAAFGVTDPAKIVNTETFRSAIAPAVASLLKSTVGSANISNSDREFAEKAAGGSISLDEGTITRLLDIMERGNVGILEGHQKRLEAIYPDEVGNKRERALFGVPMPAAPAAAGPDRAALEAEARRRGLIK